MGKQTNKTSKQTKPQLLLQPHDCDRSDKGKSLLSVLVAASPGTWSNCYASAVTSAIFHQTQGNAKPCIPSFSSSSPQYSSSDSSLLWCSFSVFSHFFACLFPMQFRSLSYHSLSYQCFSHLYTCLLTSLLFHVSLIPKMAPSPHLLLLLLYVGCWASLTLDSWECPQAAVYQCELEHL